MSTYRHYYNEIDPFAAQWLRNLMAAGIIYSGDVDERSIEDVTPAELDGYTQCHFFAGIAGWSRALQLAGWPVDREVWTGSCPCQPFSAAGKGAGFADERHLWPAWFHLIEQCRPPVVFGEQVAGAAVDAWIDLVHADLEGLAYAFRAVPFPAAGVGAPHIRDRNIWVAHAHGGVGRQGRADLRGRSVGGDAQPRARSGSGGVSGGLGDTDHTRLEGFRSGYQAEGGRPGALRPVATSGESGRLADAKRERRERRQGVSTQCVDDRAHAGRVEGNDGFVGSNEARISRVTAAGPVNGFWSAADWLCCRDGKWRPVEPGTFPLAHGVSNRVGRLRAYGNAIVPPAVAEFIKAYLACQP